MLSATDKLVDILRKDEFLNVYKVKLNPMSLKEHSAVSVYPLSGSVGPTSIYDLVPEDFNINYAIDFCVRASSEEEDVEYLLQEGLHRIFRALEENIKSAFDNVSFNGFDYDYEAAERNVGRVSVFITVLVNRNQQINKE